MKNTLETAPVLGKAIPFTFKCILTFQSVKTFQEARAKTIRKGQEDFTHFWGSVVIRWRPRHQQSLKLCFVIETRGSGDSETCSETSLGQEEKKNSLFGLMWWENGKKCRCRVKAIGAHSCFFTHLLGWAPPNRSHEADVWGIYYCCKCLQSSENQSN